MVTLPPATPAVEFAPKIVLALVTPVAVILPPARKEILPESFQVDPAENNPEMSMLVGVVKLTAARDPATMVPPIDRSELPLPSGTTFNANWALLPTLPPCSVVLPVLTTYAKLVLLIVRLPL